MKLLFQISVICLLLPQISYGLSCKEIFSVNKAIESSSAYESLLTPLLTPLKLSQSAKILSRVVGSGPQSLRALPALKGLKWGEAPAGKSTPLTTDVPHFRDAKKIHFTELNWETPISADQVKYQVIQQKPNHEHSLEIWATESQMVIRYRQSDLPLTVDGANTLIYAHRKNLLRLYSLISYRHIRPEEATKRSLQLPTGRFEVDISLQGDKGLMVANNLIAALRSGEIMGHGEKIDHRAMLSSSARFPDPESFLHSPQSTNPKLRDENGDPLVWTD